ncbi:N-acetylmuramoyl-L-alanine amidase [Mitsuokella sp.]|uniref:N-acetylmuramoyl-L-alanine amidase n=1 Tax=Mitsuokella sp. TaxID=2049034 RepID=UPI002A7F2204|nr:N-acetylmuramoyl-L-alanine amidase [Mitsuokella sp.]MDY4475009.1 N-acetylmuramoyl-L-alanine amidase [Mitsuokella sp.]
MKRVLFLFVAIVSIILLPTWACAASSDFGERVSGMTEVTGIRVNSGSEKIRIVVDANAPVSYRTMTLSNPNRVVVDLKGAWLSNKVKKNIPVDSRFVNAIRIGQFNKDTVRVVVENKVGASNYNVFSLKGGPVPGRLVMDFGNIHGDTSKATIAIPDVKHDSSGTASPSTSDAGSSTPQTPSADTSQQATDASQGQDTDPSVTDSSVPASSGQDELDAPAKEAAGDTQTSPNQPAAITDDTDADIAALTGLKGRKITIDAGHGGNDSGAIGPTGVMEKSVTLRIANELRRLLVAEGATVYMTRTTDTEVSSKGANASDIEELQARCDVANNSKSDIFISIHMDSFSSGAAKGTTGYYYSLGSKRSRDLADKVRQGVIDQIGTSSRGTQSCNFYVVKHTDMPATLVEVAFISNPQEEQLLNSEEGIKKAAQGIADGIADYFG